MARKSYREFPRSELLREHPRKAEEKMTRQRPERGTSMLLIAARTAFFSECPQAEPGWAQERGWQLQRHCTVLVLLALATAATASGQTLVVTSGGSTVSQGTTLFITTVPSMPNLALSVNGGSSCDTVSYIVDVSYTDQVGRTTWAQYNAQNEPGDQAVTVSWSGVLEGGGATVSWQFDGANESSTLDFFINGINPSPSAVDAYVSSGPWFIRNLVSQESSYRQYDGLGYPLFGPDLDPTRGGIGLFQLDPPFNSMDYWSWSANVSDGLSLLASKQSAAYQSWNNELGQMQSLTGTNPVYPPPTGYTYCYFSYPQNGNDSYADGDWIHYYNGNYFIFFHPADSSGPNRWDIDTTGYVMRVCNATPQ